MKLKLIVSLGLFAIMTAMADDVGITLGKIFIGENANKITLAIRIPVYTNCWAGLTRFTDLDKEFNKQAEAYKPANMALSAFDAEHYESAARSGGMLGGTLGYSKFTFILDQAPLEQDGLTLTFNYYALLGEDDAKALERHYRLCGKDQYKIRLAFEQGKVSAYLARDNKPEERVASINVVGAQYRSKL